MELFRKKSVDYALELSKGSQLRRELGAWDLTLLGIGAIIGTGIFVLTGLGSLTAGPALTLSFIIAGLACLFAGLTYAEFASIVPVSGSAYTYSYVTVGEFMAWIIGWDLILEYLLAVSSVSVGWSGYFADLVMGLGIQIPQSLLMTPIEGGIMNLPAFLIVLLITLLVSIGVKESKWVNNLIVALKLLVVVLFILVGFFYVKPDNWTPFMPFGFEGVFQAAAVIFFAFLGFDAVSTAAEETRNPQKDLPKGILWSLAICTILYVVTTMVMTGLVEYKEFAGHEKSPVAFAISVTGQDWLRGLVSVGATVGMLTVMLVMLYGQVRIGYSMSRDGLIPKVFSKVNIKTRTPFINTWIFGLVAACLGGFVSLKELSELVNLGTLAAFVLVSICVMILRKTQPDLPRAFRTPLVPLVPILAILFCGFLMIKLPGTSWIRFLLWLLVGLIIYFVYGYRNSELNKKK
ncbi:amino acid/polyamine/organocation transporter (APC superfamily) [Laceyella sediminis]|uniref:Amino acid/polyamine/organocation transporter (APC superfamily) n=1 Tax=Laceyella sediminis TaxID=573074 RepID=A0ABX5EQZ8_9BACL|nr:amino acid permease [Laceyella sediminis]PRZ13945.1 amino acid/polyamine/organocation transporter (APC superfamily) [Laceyella sediminis]